MRASASMCMPVGVFVRIFSCLCVCMCTCAWARACACAGPRGCCVCARVSLHPPYAERCGRGVCVPAHEVSLRYYLRPHSCVCSEQRVPLQIACATGKPTAVRRLIKTVGHAKLDMTSKDVHGGGRACVVPWLSDVLLCSVMFCSALLYGTVPF